MAIQIARRPAPALLGSASGPASYSAYVAVNVDAAVNLLEARGFDTLERPERLHVAIQEQHSFLNGLLGYAGHAAFDLRCIVTPGAPAFAAHSASRVTWRSRSAF